MPDMLDDVFSLLAAIGWEQFDNNDSFKLCGSFEGESMEHNVLLDPYARMPAMFRFMCMPAVPPVPIRYSDSRIREVFLRFGYQMPLGTFYFEESESDEIFPFLRYIWYVPCMTSIEHVMGSIEEITTLLVEFNDRCWKTAHEVSKNKEINPEHAVFFSLAPADSVGHA